MNYILDLDGTIVNSIKDLGDAINYAFKMLNLPPYDEDTIKEFIGNGSENFVIKSLEKYSNNNFEEVFELFIKYYMAHCTDNVSLYSGVMDFLEKNNGKCALLTNKSIEPTLKILDKLNIKKYFSCILGGDNAPKRKPNADGILKIISDSKWNVNETLMVGDDIPDIGAAKAAGIEVAIIFDGFGKKEELLKLNPNYSFETFEEFAAFEKFNL